MERYNFHLIEKKWRDNFLNQKLYNEKGEKFYC